MRGLSSNCWMRILVGRWRSRSPLNWISAAKIPPGHILFVENRLGIRFVPYGRSQRFVATVAGDLWLCCVGPKRLELAPSSPVAKVSLGLLAAAWPSHGYGRREAARQRPAHAPRTMVNDITRQTIKLRIINDQQWLIRNQGG